MSEQEAALKHVKKPITDEDLKKLLNLLNQIKYGSITLIIQDGRVTQIEKNEKMRL